MGIDTLSRRWVAVALAVLAVSGGLVVAAVTIGSGDDEAADPEAVASGSPGPSTTEARRARPTSSPSMTAPTTRRPSAET